MSAVSAADKKQIDQALVAAKAALAEKKLDVVTAKLKSIEPVVSRTKFRQDIFAALKANAAKESGDWAEALHWAKVTVDLVPGKPGPYKLYLEAAKNLDDEEKLNEAAIEALTGPPPDRAILETLAPTLKKAKPEVVKLFVEQLPKIDNWEDLGFGSFLPQTEETAEIRLSLLKREAKTSEKAQKKLVWYYLRDHFDMNEAMKYAKMLPEDHSARIYCETLFGPNPVESAKRYKGTLFDNFLAAAEKGDVAELEKQIGYIDNFLSGWLMLAKMKPDPKQRLFALNKVIKKFPNSAEVLSMFVKTLIELGQYEEVSPYLDKLKMIDPAAWKDNHVRFMIATGRATELQPLLDSNSLDSKEAAVVEMLLYKHSQDKIWLRKILDLEITADIVNVRAEALYELREELGDSGDAMFAATAKASPSGAVFMFFGKYQLWKGEHEKGVFLMQKALTQGSFDEETIDVLSKDLITQEKLDEALKVLSRLWTPVFHFRAALILQRLGKHREACEHFVPFLKENPDHVIANECYGQSLVVLGQALPAQSIASKINDMDLNSQLAVLRNLPMVISNDEDFQLEKTPVIFMSFLQYTIAFVDQLRVSHRNESVRVGLAAVMGHIPQFLDKWGSLASAQKIAGDVYFRHFLVEANQESLGQAIQCFKRRAELDKRAESFIDLARVIYHAGQTEASLTILLRVVKVFVQNPGLWLNLGIAFALVGKVNFAKHVFSIASKIADKRERSLAFGFLSFFFQQEAQKDLAEKAMKKATDNDMTSPILWKLIASSKSDSWTEYYELRMKGAEDEGYSAAFAESCFRVGRAGEGLSYALSSGDDDLIAKFQEAVGNYEAALEHQKDEAARERLKKLISERMSGTLSVYNGKTAQGSGYDHIAAGILYLHQNNTEKAKSEFDKATAELPELSKNIQSLSDAWLGGKHQNSADEMESCVIEAMKQSEPNLEEIDEQTQELLSRHPSMTALNLRLCACLRCQNYKEALKTVQLILVIRPSLYRKFRSLTSKLQKFTNS